MYVLNLCTKSGKGIRGRDWRSSATAAARQHDEREAEEEAMSVGMGVVCVGLYYMNIYVCV